MLRPLHLLRSEHGVVLRRDLWFENLHNRCQAFHDVPLGFHEEKGRPSRHLDEVAQVRADSSSHLRP